MKATEIIILFFFVGISSTAQVGIGTTAPDPATVLDITASNKGIIIPRVALNNISNTMIDGINTVPEGMLLYNTNASVIGGGGVGFYFFNGTVWEKLNGLTPGSSDADWFVESTTSVPTSINDNIYTNGKVAIGRQDTPSALNVRTQAETTAVTIDMIVPADIAQTGIFTRINHTGSDVLYGFRNDLTKFGTGQQIGISQNLSGDTDGIKIGLTNTLSGNGAERFFGVINTVSGNGDERKFGVANTVYGNGNGRKFGTSNSVYGAGNGVHYGTSNDVRGTGNNTRIGTSNSMTGSGTGRNYGTSNSMGGTNTGWQVGVSNSITSDADGNNYAVFNTLTGDGAGTHYATYNNINNGGDGIKYGEYSYIDAIGTGVKYGNYITITNASGGDHYGLYVHMRRSTGNVFAGYFLGRVAIGTTASNTYTFPSSRGAAGQVMQTDGSGNLTWVTPTAPLVGGGLSSEERTTLEANASEVKKLTTQIDQLKQIIMEQQKQLESINKAMSNK